jgi:hypothetical protein
MPLRSQRTFANGLDHFFRSRHGTLSHGSAVEGRKSAIRSAVRINDSGQILCERNWNLGAAQPIGERCRDLFGLCGINLRAQAVLID